MPTLNIGGQRVNVGDDFLQLSPDQQNQTVEEIASQLSGTTTTNAAQNGPMIKVGDRQLSVDEYRALPDHERQSLRDQISETTHHTKGMGQSSVLDPFVQGVTFGFADELRGAVQGGIAAAQGGDFGETYDQVVDESRASLARERRVNPIGSVAAEIAGAIPTAMVGGGQLAAKGATLASRAFTGGAVGTGQGAVYGAGAGEGNIIDRLPNAMLGAGLGGAGGAVAPYVGNAIQNKIRGAAQGRILNHAVKDAPTSEQIKATASRFFDQVDGANPSITKQAFSRLYSNIEGSLRRIRPNQALDDKAIGALKVLQSMSQELSDPSLRVAIDLKDLHILRQAAQSAGAGGGRNSAISGIMVDQIDDFIKQLKPSDIAGGGDPKAATSALFKGISTWAKASKASVIEEAMFRAENVASGVENGMRIEFRKLIQNPATRKMFNQAELQAIRDVANGTFGMNAMKVLGSIGVDTNSKLMPLLATAAGGMTPVGIPGALAGVAASTVARKGGERLAHRAANRALAAAVTDGLKVLPDVDPSKIPISEFLTRQAAIPTAGQMVR